MSSASIPRSTFHAFPLPAPASFRPKVFVPRSEVPASTLAAEATTYGWDTVNCVKLPIVNEVLAQSKQYPASLSATINSKEQWTISANFGAWQIAPGGSGSILMMKLPLTSASMTVGTDTLSISDGWVLISLKLRYVPQANSKAQEINPLDVEQLIADAVARSPDDPAVVVQAVGYGSAQPSESMKSLFRFAMAELLTNNLDKFTHVFAVVNLNQRATSPQFYWMKPTYTSYAYFQGIDDDNSYFAVLNQTENRSPAGLSNQIAAAAIPDGANASILVSNQLFMQQFVMPGMPRAFPKADSQTFAYANNNQVIEAKKSFALEAVRVGAIDYTPNVQNFRIQIVGDEIQINTKVSIDISPGIVAYVDATYYYVLGLVRKDDGSMTLDFIESSPPIINSWYTTEFWVTMTQLIVSIIGAVIGAVIGEMIKTVATKVIVIAIITIVAGVAAAIPSIIADVISKGTAAALPSIGALIDDATDPVDWPASSGFSLQSAELNGALQFGGNLSVSSK